MSFDNLRGRTYRQRKKKKKYQTLLHPSSSCCDISVWSKMSFSTTRKENVLTHSPAKPTHLVDHLDLPEGQTVQPVHLHHVALPMGLCQLDGKRKRDRGGRKKVYQKYTKIKRSTSVFFSRTGHSTVADVQTAQPITHNFSARSQSSICGHTLSSQSTHQVVWVSGM